MKKLNILIIILLTSVLLPLTIHAVSVKGYVYDKKTKEPIIGAFVTILGQNIGAQTDFDGCFSIKNIPSDTKKLLIKSLGYKEQTLTVNFTEDSVTQDLGIIYLKSARSKHYNRITVSFNPVTIPTPTSFDPYNNEIEYFSDQSGISGSYLYGYNFFKNLAVELGAEYNYTYSIVNGTGHYQSKHHSVAIFTNLMHNFSIRNVTVSPYVGLYMRRFLYSKLSVGDSQGCILYDMKDHLNKKSENLGVQFGLGYKYKFVYMGCEISYDFNQDRSHDIVDHTRIDSSDPFLEYSVSLGFEF